MNRQTIKNMTMPMLFSAIMIAGVISGVYVYHNYHRVVEPYSEGEWQPPKRGPSLFDKMFHCDGCCPYDENEGKDKHSGEKCK